jgi:hypothetical protein
MRNLLPIFVIFLLISWTWAAGRVRVAVQPLRLQLAARGEVLLANDKLPAHLRPLVMNLLDTAFSNRAMLLFGLGYVPVVALRFIIAPNELLNSFRNFAFADAETRGAFDEFVQLHNRITFANNPVLSSLLDVEIAFFMGSAVLIVAAARQVASEFVSAGTTKGLVETAGIEVRGKIFPHLGTLKSATP